MDPMEKIGNIISQIMGQSRYAKRSRQGPIFDRWSEIVGEPLADKCRPVAVRKNVLIVNVADSVWMQELQFQKLAILERIWEKVEKDAVTDIRWIIGGEVKPRLRRGTSIPGPTPERSLSQEEKAWVRAVSAEVGDSDLREIVERALSRHLKARSQDGE
jgi:hypothetical protein